MAIRILLADSEHLTQSNSASNDPYTAMFWFLLDTVEVVNQGIFGRAGTGNASVAVGSTGRLSLQVTGYGYDYGSILTLDTWYHLAATRSGTSHEVFIDGVSDMTLTGNTNTRDTITVGHDTEYGLEMDGRIAAIKVWDAVLTPAEINNELYFFTPLRTSGNQIWTPLVADETVNFRDYSGNAADWTEVGTIDAGEGPPITWRKGASKIFVPLGVAADISHVAALADSFDNVVQRRPIKITNF